MIFVIVIVVPVAFVIIMDFMEMLFSQAVGWQRRTMKVAWDVCVLALGLTGGLFADPEILRIMNARGVYTAPGFLLLSIIISLTMAVFIALLRRGDNPSGWLALVSLVLGGMTLILPTYLVLLR